MEIRCINPWSWYAVAASGDLQTGDVMPGALNGEPLVVWRSQAGQASVWNDRCPHRGMRLSLGTTRDGALICPYHGWEFVEDGFCNRIPAHPGLSPSSAARARCYPTVETGGYVWACTGEPATAGPDFRLVSDLDLRPVRTMHFQFDAETVTMALLLQPIGRIAAPSAAQSAAKWNQTNGVMTVTEGADGGIFIAKLEFPGVIVGSGQDADGQSYGYAALIQPTGDGSTAVHLALIDPGHDALAERLALNQAAVMFRRSLPDLMAGNALGGLRERLARMPDLQQPDLAGA